VNPIPGLLLQLSEVFKPSLHPNRRSDVPVRQTDKRNQDGSGKLEIWEFGLYYKNILMIVSDDHQ